MAKKKSFQGTANNTNHFLSESRYASQISGLVKWEFNKFGLVSGSFKQQDNPAAIDFKTQNIVQKGCYFTQASSMICLALNVGSKSFGNTLKSSNKGTIE